MFILVRTARANKVKEMGCKCEPLNTVAGAWEDKSSLIPSLSLSALVTRRPEPAGDRARRWDPGRILCVVEGSEDQVRIKS